MTTSPDAPAVDFSSLRVAIVHEWFITYAGAERVVEQMLNVFPQADLFAVVDFLPPDERWFIKDKKVNTSFVQKLPLARKLYRSYLPFMPLAVEQFDVSGYDLVISSNHAVAKGVITGPDQMHICMCYSPMRYAWDLTHQYLRESGLNSGLKSWLTRILLHRVRMWDYRTANGVDEFIAISDYIARRINKVYRRPASVIYPPVNVDKFELSRNKKDFYFAASRMVPYKKMDLIVEAFTRLGDRQLIVAGEGPQLQKVKKLAGPNITFLNYLPFETLKKYLSEARAFVFAAEEDFGIIAVEAQACGTPVIAFGKGGAAETVQEGVTGLFFDRQEPDSLIAAIRRFEKLEPSLNSEKIREHTRRFVPERFRREFSGFVARALDRDRGESSPDNRPDKDDIVLPRKRVSFLFRGKDSEPRQEITKTEG